ncbi:MAG TPA: hypothetical protein PK103_01415 [Elusimicrobiales bacterium]|nr:hypothetical protein [Elusimicrobiales bacterium]HOL62003.1 hypothetical protein [Elusimicrobiales bacterium]HPO94495.1 hypothetical protein [Elusimicrobiales bacterium]
MKKIILMIGAVAVMSLGLKAENKYDEKYFTIGDVKVEQIDVGITKGGGIPLNPVPAPADLPKPPDVKPPSDPVDPGNIGGGSLQGTLSDVNAVVDTLDKIVNLAQKIFEIIEKNQPVVNINVNYANAIPYGIQHWTQLQGWAKPKTVGYAFVAKNAYGAEVVKVRYQVQFRYNGNYQGKGKFLTGVTIEPISVETAWGYKVSLTAEVPDSTIANVGTHEDPIASMQVQLKWTIHTVIKDAQQKAIYYVQGDGKIEEIASPFAKKSAEVSKKVNIEVPAEGGVVENIKSTKF